MYKFLSYLSVSSVMSALGSCGRFMGMEREATLTCSTRTELCAVVGWSIRRNVDVSAFPWAFWERVCRIQTNVCSSVICLLFPWFVFSLCSTPLKLSNFSDGCHIWEYFMKLDVCPVNIKWWFLGIWHRLVRYTCRRFGGDLLPQPSLWRQGSGFLWKFLLGPNDGERRFLHIIGMFPKLKWTESQSMAILTFLIMLVESPSSRSQASSIFSSPRSVTAPRSVLAAFSVLWPDKRFSSLHIFRHGSFSCSVLCFMLAKCSGQRANLP